MVSVFQRVFLSHPASVNETYFAHMFFALRFAFRLFKAAFAALIHAFIPCCCEKTASSEIKELYRLIQKR